ncbi:hypothetical protein D3C78_20600 [compost metagenome]
MERKVILETKITNGQMFADTNILVQMKQAYTERAAAEQRYMQVLEQLELPIPEEIYKTELEDFTIVYNVELICTKPINRDTYYHCGGEYHYFLVTTDNGAFFAVSAFIYDTTGSYEERIFEPSMSVASEKIYLQYLVDNLEEGEDAINLHSDPGYVLQELIENEQEQQQINSLVEKVTLIYDQIREQILCHWSAKEYLPIAVYDAQIEEAIQQQNIDAIKKNWAYLSSAIAFHPKTNADFIKTLSDFDEEFK